MKKEKRKRILVRDFEISQISELEIKFSRHILDEIIEYQDFVRKFEIHSDPLEFRRFIIHVVREYDTFQNDLLNHLSYP